VGGGNYGEWVFNRVSKIACVKVCACLMVV